jgi:predicted MFS family arabinose efflux permease
LLALAGNIGIMFVSRAIEGLGGGNLGVAQSYVSDVTTEEQRPRAFAYGTIAFGLGFVVGPILSGLLVHFGLAVPFFVAAGLQALNLILTATLLPESRAGERAATKWPSVLAAVKKPAVTRLLVQQFLYIFAFTYLFTTLSLYLSHVFNAGPAVASLLLGVAGGTGALAEIFLVDPLVRRFGAAGTARGAFALGVFAYALIAGVRDLRFFIAVLVLWALSGAILRPTLTTQLSGAAPEDRRGAVLGFGDSLNNLAMIFSPAIGSAVVGYDARLSGILPALSLAAGFALSLGRRARPSPPRV